MAGLRVWLDGRLVGPGEARVSVLDLGLTVGLGAFETMKVVDGVPFALSRHLDRLAASARTLGLDVPADDRLRDAVAEVLRATPVPLQRLRVTLTGGAPSAAGGRPVPSLVVVLAPLDPPPATAVAVTVPWPRNERGALVGVKATSYAENVLALAEARRRGADEALLGDTTGRLCEGTTSNVLVALDGRLLTPTLASGCLPGVTRGLVLQWCGVEELDVAVGELATVGQLALTSSTRDVQPVRRLDGRVLGTGGLVQRAREEFARRAALDADP